jgi:CheY-like chemotaxis protein
VGVEAMSARAFFSYTRLDDEFLGGSITELRRLFELGVRVVTGDKDFSIFQDIEGIELGQKWQERIDEALLESSFLIPIVTPLYFTSEACRDELTKFIDHEKSHGMRDRILPVYFHTSPRLEKPELRAEDPLAREIASRHRYDWRSLAYLPNNDPQVRRAVRDIAAKIDGALPRIATAPSPESPPAGSAVAVDGIPASPPRATAPRRRSVVLWVDDAPANNVIEREAMAPYNIEFVIATSTEQALAELRGRVFDAIVSDMGRPGDKTAGFTLLESIRSRGDQTPCFFYTSAKSDAFKADALRRGAQGITQYGEDLLEMLLEVIRPRR